MDRDRPFVYVNMASSVDGKITSAAREYPKMTSAADRTEMDRLRSTADAILVGAGTLRADDPPLHVRDEALRRERVAAGRPVELPRIVVSRSLSLPSGSRFFADDGAPRIVATVRTAPADRKGSLAARAEVWELGDDTVDVTELLRRLRARGVLRLLVEGGGELNWHLVAADLVDELHVTFAPTLLGGREAPTLLEGSGFPMAEQRRLELLSLRREGSELYSRWRVIRDRA